MTIKDILEAILGGIIGGVIVIPILSKYLDYRDNKKDKSKR